MYGSVTPPLSEPTCDFSLNSQAEQGFYVLSASEDNNEPRDDGTIIFSPFVSSFRSVAERRQLVKQ